VKLKICWIGKTKEASIAALTDDYLKRIGRFVPLKSHELRNEAALLALVTKERARPELVLLDARGRQMTSEEFATFLTRHQAHGTQTLVLAIGAADGWSDTARRAATQFFSLSRMTLPHELARVVLLEQTYRAFTILSGHPYHRGH
jgi:23S rRNA (pseudouridine1915-N3)-methyltransferase